jgi:hypothetical protein
MFFQFWPGTLGNRRSASYKGAVTIVGRTAQRRVREPHRTWVSAQFERRLTTSCGVELPLDAGHEAAHRQATVHVTIGPDDRRAVAVRFGSVTTASGGTTSLCPSTSTQ